MTITEDASAKVDELIQQGWELTITWGNSLNPEILTQRWEACFTRRLPSGLFDNHEEAVGLDLSAVLIEACNYVRDGIKYSKKSHKI